MLQELYNICQEFKNTSGKNDKKSLLKRESQNILFKQYIKYVLDPLATYGLQDKKIKKFLGKNTDKSIGNKTLFDIFEYLEKHPTGTDKDAEIVARFIDAHEDKEIKDFILESVTKKMKLGISEKTVNEVWGKGFLNQFEVMLAKKYEDEQHKIEGKEFVLTEKYDGCFMGNMKVNMADGSMKKIKDIEVDDEVLSFDENTNEVSSKKVTNIFNNGKKASQQWKQLKFKNKKGQMVKGTLNHKIFTPNGWKEIGELKIGDKVYIYDYQYSPEQLQVIFGTGLGDSSIVKDNEDLPKIRMGLGRTEKHKSFQDKIVECLSDFKGTEYIRNSGYGSTIIHHSIKTMNDLPYYLVDKEYIRGVSYKIELDSIKFLSPLGLAIFYLDDGTKRANQEDGDYYSSNVRPRATINMNKFPKGEIIRLSDYLYDKFSLETTIGEDKVLSNGDVSYRLDFNADNTAKLFDIIAPYVPQEMRYKLGDKWSDVPVVEWWKNKGKFKMIEDEIVDIIQSTQGHTAYDIEVEDNHTYFIENLAVHNCRAVFIKKNNNIKCFSRQGQLITGLTEIEKEIAQLPDAVYDGELLIKDYTKYKDRNVLQETLKITRKDGEKTGVNFMLFDVISNEDFEEGKSKENYLQRRAFLSNHVLSHQFENVHLIPILYRGKELDVIPDLLAQLEAQGKEGLMLNIVDAPYECKRSSNILKLKTMLTADLQVIGFEKGKPLGKYENTLGTLIVDYKGYPLGVSGFSDEMRDEIWNNKSKYLGAIAEVQYFRESQNEQGGLSVSFPQFKGWRWDKNEPSYN